MPDVLHIQEHGHTGYGTIMDYGKHFAGVQGQYDGFGALIEVAARIKSCVSIPVGAVGAMDPRVTPDLIDRAIADGKMDYILVTRPLMADPQYCNKLQAGQKEDIAPCTRCMTCFVAPYDFGMPMYCRVNASLTRAFTPDKPEGYDPLPTEPKQKVLVIGGGPAGMEAARIAAQRGHTVTLLEKEDGLGLTLRELAAIKDPHERIADHLNYLLHQLNKYGVTVRTGVTVTAETVKAEAPDGVIVAVGGCYAQLDVPGFEHVQTANALPKATNRALFDELTAAGMHVFAVGDCYSPSTIANAIARANIVARNVEKQQQTATALAGDQVYTATATGIGDVTVSIRVEGGQITETLVDTANETQGIGRELGEQFAREIVEKHSIDAVSGATVTTNAANQALAQCLKQAGL